MKNYLLFSALFAVLLFTTSFNFVHATDSGIKVSITATPILPPTQPQSAIKFTYNFTKNLTVGSKGVDVLEMQKFLSAKGFFKTEPIGEFGPKTLDAVKAFQTANSIPSTGFVGPMTLKALNDLNK